MSDGHLEKGCVPTQIKGLRKQKFFTNFVFFGHNFACRYLRKSFKGSKDADFGLVSETILCHNNGPMGWSPGPGKGSQKHLHLWRFPPKTTPQKRNFFFRFHYKTCWIPRRFEQLSSSIAWRVIGLQSSARNMVFVGLKGFLKQQKFSQSGRLLIHQFSKKLQDDQAWSGQNWFQFWCSLLQCWSVLISAASGLGLEMARSKIFQARTAHSPQHSAH